MEGAAKGRGSEEGGRKRGGRMRAWVEGEKVYVGDEGKRVRGRWRGR